jgi:hypothetical protein
VSATGREFTNELKQKSEIAEVYKYNSKNYGNIRANYVSRAQERKLQ